MALASINTHSWRQKQQQQGDLDRSAHTKPTITTLIKFVHTEFFNFSSTYLGK